MIKSLREVQLGIHAPVVQIALGEFHGIGLTANGKVLVWGMEQGPEVAIRPGVSLGPEFGLMPERAAMNQPEPRVLDVSRGVIGVAAGAYHSALITDDGRLWTWGQNSRKQLGHGPEAPDHLCTPTVVRTLDRGSGHRITAVSLGGFHSAAVDESGLLFTWGDNRRGQCGQGEVGIVDTPEQLKLAPSEPQCIGVSCGGMFSIFEAEEGALEEGSGRGRSRFYACGWGKDGCLGFGQVCKRQLRPRPWPAPPDNQQWKAVVAGAVHVAGFLMPQ